MQFSRARGLKLLHPYQNGRIIQVSIILSVSSIAAPWGAVRCPSIPTPCPSVYIIQVRDIPVRFTRFLVGVQLASSIKLVASAVIGIIWP